jgi:hypothetical protein
MAGGISFASRQLIYVISYLSHYFFIAQEHRFVIG